jgi:hypothetical protein
LLQNYYFTVASLPSIQYSGDYQLTVEEFLEICRSFVNQPDWQLLTKFTIDPDRDKEKDPADSVLKIWNAWDHQLRLELSRLRSQKFNPENSLQTFAYSEPEIQTIAKTAMNLPSPLEAELFLDQKRWDFLESLKQNHYFDVFFLGLYYLQLQLLKRKHQFNKQIGQEKFNESYTKIIKTTNN